MLDISEEARRQPSDPDPSTSKKRYSPQTSLKYGPLDDRKPQIRLFRLLTASSNSEARLEGELRTFDLATAPRYNALSYVWGPAKGTHSILINDLVYVCGKNFYLFLEEFGEIKSGRDGTWLWIDQICINQGNNTERNHQVSIIFAIYGSADCVIIWMSEDAESVSNRPPTKLKLEDATQIFHLTFGASNYGSDSGNPGELDEEEERVVSTIRIMLSNQCFDRLWIVQEVSLANNTWIFVRGGTWFSWLQFYKIAGNYTGNWADLQSPRHLLVWHLTRSNGLFGCLESFGDRKCQETRDKIYGLQALAPPEQRVPVDYEKPIQCVLADVAQIWLRIGGPSYHVNALVRLGEQLGLDNTQQNDWRGLVSALSRSAPTPESNLTIALCHRDQGAVGYDIPTGHPGTNEAEAGSPKRNGGRWWFKSASGQIEYPVFVADDASEIKCRPGPSKYEPTFSGPPGPIARKSDRHRSAPSWKGFRRIQTWQPQTIYSGFTGAPIGEETSAELQKFIPSSAQCATTASS